MSNKFELNKKMIIATCIAPVNIAVIKYWGKRDETLILPINDSISASLDTNQLCAKTTICASPDFKENRIWLNGKEESFNNKRLLNCLEQIKCRSKRPDISNWKIHICSENNFPTAAGLASSAAGYACLVATLAKIYNVSDELSLIARQGSGSACRSIYGGWVQWLKGSLDNGEDSIAKQIVLNTYWPEIRILILVVDNKEKKYSSTVGMEQSVKTSDLIKHRADIVVPQRVNMMIDAIKNRNFEKFAELTMKDSNQFHAICLDTYPPCVYLNDISHTIIELIHKYNSVKGSTKVAYTFDAGPNACLFLQQENIDEVLALINEFIPPPTNSNEQYFKGIPIKLKQLNEEIKSGMNVKKQQPGLLKYIIHTKVGEGPQQTTEHLLGNDGFPKKLN